MALIKETRRPEALFEPEWTSRRSRLISFRWRCRHLLVCATSIWFGAEASPAIIVAPVCWACSGVCVVSCSLLLWSCSSTTRIQTKEISFGPSVCVVSRKAGETRYGCRWKSEGSNCSLRLREAVRECLIRRSVATSSRRYWCLGESILLGWFAWE